MNARRRRALLFSGLGLAFTAAALAALNVVARFCYARLDLSAGGAYSVSPGTRAVLARVKDELLIRVYFTGRLPPPYGLTEQYLRDLLAEYRGAGRGRVRVEFVDPDSSEARKREAAEAGLVPVQINTMSRDKFEAKEAFMGAVFLYAGRREALPVIEGPEELEYALTRRVKRLVEPALKTAGFLTGHGETSLTDASLGRLSALIGEQMKTETVTLDKPLPSRLDALWILGPTRKFSAAELDALRAWVGSGKSLGIFLGRRLVDSRSFQTQPLRTGLDDLLRGWGLDEREGLVVDGQCEKIQMRSRFGQFMALRVQEYPYMPIVKSLNRRHPAVSSLEAVTFPFVHPLVFRPGAGTRYESLADSSRLSWYQSSDVVSPPTSLEKVESNEPGPFSLAGVLSVGQGKVIVIGSQYLLDARLIDKASTAAFILNLLDWSFQDQDLLSVRAKGPSFRPLRRLRDGERVIVKYFLILFLPLTLLTCAFWLHARRRQEREALPALYVDA